MRENKNSNETSTFVKKIDFLQFNSTSNTDKKHFSTNVVSILRSDHGHRDSDIVKAPPKIVNSFYTLHFKNV